MFKRFVFYFALTMMVLAASFSPQIPPDSRQTKVVYKAQKGKKKKDTAAI